MLWYLLSLSQFPVIAVFLYSQQLSRLISNSVSYSVLVVFLIPNSVPYIFLYFPIFPVRLLKQSILHLWDNYFVLNPLIFFFSVHYFCFTLSLLLHFFNSLLSFGSSEPISQQLRVVSFLL